MFLFPSPGKRGVGLAAGSNALASQLYSKNVNNTSSRSSNGGDNEDFCSDASLEDDVVDLGHKVTSYTFFLYSNLVKSNFDLTWIDVDGRETKAPRGFLLWTILLLFLSRRVRRKFFLLLSNPIIFHLFSFSKKRKLPDAGGFFFAFNHLLLYNYTIRQVIVLTPLENPHRGGDFRLIYFQKPFFICYREIYFYSFIYLMLFAFDQKVSTILLKLSRIKRWNCIGFRHSSLSRLM